MEHRTSYRCSRLLDPDRRSVGRRLPADAQPVLCHRLERRGGRRATRTDQRRPADRRRKSRPATPGSSGCAQRCQRDQRGPTTSALCRRGRPERGIHCRRRLIGHRYPCWQYHRRAGRSTAQAQAFAGDIRLRAEQLNEAEVKTAGQLTATTTGLSSVGFAEQPISNPVPQAPATHRNGIQLVDFKQNGGGDPPPFAPWDTPDGTPPQPAFIPQYEQVLTAPTAPPTPDPPMPASPPQAPRPATGPSSVACQQALDEQQQSLLQNLGGATLGGAVLGGLAAGVPTEGVGAVQGAIGGAFMGGVGEFLNEARKEHPLPQQCK